MGERCRGYETNDNIGGTPDRLEQLLRENTPLSTRELETREKTIANYEAIKSLVLTVLPAHNEGRHLVIAAIEDCIAEANE